jgi:antitoxin (DNA-binding transcriptional repressor) of toxin-antitoxin stability system
LATKTISSEKARTQWRDIIESAIAGNDIVIERYGKPIVAMISYEDFLELEEILEEMREAREAEIVLDEWQRDASTARPWDEVKSDLIADGLLDE